MLSEEIHQQIWNANMHREQEHHGKSHFCEQCNHQGIIGEDLHAATYVAMNNTAWAWWICSDCLDKKKAAAQPQQDV